MKDINVTESMAGGRMERIRIGMESGKRIRISIHKDGYEQQSYAKVEKWSDSSGWMFIHWFRGDDYRMRDLHRFPKMKNGVELGPFAQMENRRLIDSLEAELILVAREVVS